MKQLCDILPIRASILFAAPFLLSAMLFATGGISPSPAAAAEEEFQLKFFDISDGQLAFTYIKGEVQEIYKIDFAALDVRPLIQGPEKKSNPSFSPDGKRLAYNSELKGVNQIFVADSDGKNITKITSGATPSENPSWSPDGKKIVFHSLQQGLSSLVMVDADGTHPQVLLKNQHRNITPVFSPRGDEILYASNQDWPGWDIFLFDLNSRFPAPMTKGEGSFLLPAWQPFGEGFIFGRGEGQKVTLWYAGRGSAQASRISPADGKYLDATWVVDSDPAQSQYVFAAHERMAGKGDFQLEVAKQLPPAKGEEKNQTPHFADFVLVLQAKGIVRHPTFTPFPSLESLSKKLERKRTNSPAS